ncbi:AAA family ATPase [Bradyrhizobium sp. TZ2]
MLRSRRGTAVAAIIVDTLARAMTGQSDSDGAAMGVFVGNCDTIARAFGCFVGAVHHSPRNDDSHSRGSNVLDGAADVIISVVKENSSGISTAKVDHLKDGEEGATWRFRVTPVEVLLRNKTTCFAPSAKHWELSPGKTRPKQGETENFPPHSSASWTSSQGRSSIMVKPSPARPSYRPGSRPSHVID